MRMNLSDKFQQGFTLVELLIVVIILAILAAIVVPQFTGSTDDAKESSLTSTLASMRAIIDLYYQQHGHYPSSVAISGSATGCTGTIIGASAVNLETTFLAQLTNYTNIDGQACNKKDATSFKYGPYLKKALLPDNPITNDDTLAISTTGTLPLVADTPRAGWKFDNITGQFVANDQAKDHL